MKPGNLFDRKRILPGDLNIVSEGYKVSEREQILRNATMLNFAHAGCMDGIYIEHATRATTEVQQNGKALSTGDCCLLTVNPRLLAERAACTLYQHDESRLQNVIDSGRAALATASSSDRALFDARLREIGIAEVPNEVVQVIERLVSEAAAHHVRISTASTREEAESIGQEIGDQVAPDAAGRLERFARIMAEIPADARRAGRLDEACRLISAALQWVTDLGATVAERVTEYRATTADRRGDLLRASRHRQAESGGTFWRIVSNFFREQAAVQPNSSQRERVTREYIEALGKEVVHSALESGVRCIHSSLQREADRVRHALDLAEGKARRGAAWRAVAWRDSAPIRGICLEDVSAVIESVTAGLHGPETDREIGLLGDAVEQSTPVAFAARLEQTARTLPGCSMAINDLFGMLHREDQDSILNRLLAMPSVPVRRVASAVWQMDYIYACPGGPNSPLGRAAQRQPNSARYRIGAFNDLPNTAVAIVWINFLRPAELEAYHEGRAALEQIATSPTEAMPFYAIPALANEADPLLDDGAVDELIVKGFAVGIISASRAPAIPPFYFVNGHAGGRPVHTLAPHVKRQLPKLGNTNAEMRRAIATNAAHRAEVKTVWSSRLQQDGGTALAALIRNLLAQDTLNTPDLRQAAGRVVHQLERQE